MPKVSSLLCGKQCKVETIGGMSSVLDAAVLMNEHRIGSLMVVESGQVRGILTERDILTRVVAPSLDPNTTSVSDVMTTELLTCCPETKLSEVRSVMRSKRIRHLPVLDDRKLVGIISIGDLNVAENEELEQTIHHMEVYMAGAPFTLS